MSFVYEQNTKTFSVFNLFMMKKRRYLLFGYYTWVWFRAHDVPKEKLKEEKRSKN